MVAETSTELIRDPTSALEDCRLAFIGCGVMAEAMIAGVLRKKLVSPDNIVGSHPRLTRREELHVKYGIEMFEHNREAALAAAPDASATGSMLILAVKPQRLPKVLDELKGSIHPDQLIVSVVAGAKIQTISDELLHAAVVRTMPNTPAQIGEGVTAWTSSAAVSEQQETHVRALLEALGKTVRVENERQIDMATALSATGPTYIFLVMEALIDAGVHMVFHDTSQRNWSTRRCSAQFCLRESRTSIRRSCATWLHHPAERQPKRSIRWRKVVCGRFCRRRCGPRFSEPKRWVASGPRIKRTTRISRLLRKAGVPVRGFAPTTFRQYRLLTPAPRAAR